MVGKLVNNHTLKAVLVLLLNPLGVVLGLWTHPAEGLSQGVVLLHRLTSLVHDKTNNFYINSEEACQLVRSPFACHYRLDKSVNICIILDGLGLADYWSNRSNGVQFFASNLLLGNWQVFLGHAHESIGYPSGLFNVVVLFRVDNSPHEGVLSFLWVLIEIKSAEGISLVGCLVCHFLVFKVLLIEIELARSLSLDCRSLELASLYLLHELAHDKGWVWKLHFAALVEEFSVENI